MQPSARLLAVLAVAITTVGAHATTISLNANVGSAWQAITPPGATPNNSYPSPSPINGVGLAWEAANVGWNSSASYNSSGWGAYSGNWSNPGGITPFYARQVFHIGGTPTSGSFMLFVDDDSQVWVNGTFVTALDDHNQSTGGNVNASHTADISSFLVSGDNVIAFKAHNSAGGGYSAQLSGSVSFSPAAANLPEPGSLALAGLASCAALGLRRRARAQPA